MQWPPGKLADCMKLVLLNLLNKGEQLLDGPCSVSDGDLGMTMVEFGPAAGHRVTLGQML